MKQGAPLKAGEYLGKPSFHEPGEHRPKWPKYFAWSRTLEPIRQGILPLTRKLAIATTAGIRIPARWHILCARLFDRDGWPAQQFRQVGGAAFRACNRFVPSDQLLKLLIAFRTPVFVDGHASPPIEESMTEKSSPYLRTFRLCGCPRKWDKRSNLIQRT